MKIRFLLWAVLATCAVGAKAEVLPAEKLLPSDTLFVVSTSDSAKLKGAISRSPQSQLWHDPAMKAFRENFMTKFTGEVVAPLEKAFGVDFDDYKALAEGQFTFAITENGWKGQPDQSLGLVLLLDTKTNSAALKTNLANLKKKWVESGKQLKTEKIRDVEFTTLITTDKELDDAIEKVSPKNPEDLSAEDPADKKPKKLEISVGQYESLLIVANTTKVIEKILASQTGGIVPSLADNASFETSNSLFRDSAIYAWLNIRPLVDLAKNASPQGSPELGAASFDKIFGALGLNGLKSAAFSISETPEGQVAKFFVAAPEAERKGILKLFTLQPKDANPPAFVPIEAVKFSRTRLDLQKGFNGLEAILGEIFPMYTGVFKFIFDSAGKDQDPNYDLRKELVGNLGDDLIRYERAPRGTSVEDFNSPPTLFLVSSPNPDRLANALKIAMVTLSPEGSAAKDREFLGRKLYTFSLPGGLPGADAKSPPKSLHFAASGGYVGISTDVAMLEEYLRSNDGKVKPLSDTAGLTEAAQKVNGMATGLFSYENQTEKARATFELLKRQSGSMAMLFGASAFSSGATTPTPDKTKQWADFSLLPPFESVSKYFSFTVYSGSFDVNGLSITIFSPTPTALKK